MREGTKFSSAPFHLNSLSVLFQLDNFAVKVITAVK